MALTRAQWTQICFQGFGLRSARDPEDIGTASYALDDGAIGMAALSLPAGWDEKLARTLNFIAGFGNSEGRYLLIVKGVRGTGEGYDGGFKKCSSRPSSVAASTVLSGTTVETLTEWVLSHLPET